MKLFIFKFKTYKWTIFIKVINQYKEIVLLIIISKAKNIEKMKRMKIKIIHNKCTINELNFI